MLRSIATSQHMSVGGYGDRWDSFPSKLDRQKDLSASVCSGIYHQLQKQNASLLIEIIKQATMAQIIDPVPSGDTKPILCCYVNASSQIQVARITNIQNWYFERVVFPGQRLVFEALRSAQLEIHTGMMASSILSDKIPCDRLALEEPSSLDSEDEISAQTLDSRDRNSSIDELGNLAVSQAV